jgi:hypothetical protein
LWWKPKKLATLALKQEGIFQQIQQNIVSKSREAVQVAKSVKCDKSTYYKDVEIRSESEVASLLSEIETKYKRYKRYKLMLLLAPLQKFLWKKKRRTTLRGNTQTI